MEQTLKRYIPAVLLLGAIAVIFVLLIMKHYEIRARDISNAIQNIENTLIVFANTNTGIHTCDRDERFYAFSHNTYVCIDPEYELQYESIYYTYPVSAGGRERAYAFLDSGERDIAEAMLDNVFMIPRYDPVTIDPITWREDPYGERYWRFIFYSLRPTRHLLAYAREEHDPRAFEKLRGIISSFAERGVEQPFAWDDPHGAAFRTMVLVNTWWKLREAGELTPQVSDDILAALEMHGAYLLEPEHYEENSNHGITQAAALLVLGENFPDLPQASVWRETGIERLDRGLDELVDPDGVLIENTPYYHLYSLEKYWEIYAYVQTHDIPVSDAFLERIEAMIDHAAYVLQPDRDIPLLGASIPRRIRESGELGAMATENPSLEYVLSEGERGVRPEALHVQYPSSGIVIMRSGWGETRPYQKEAQVLFDTGPYRTSHSDLDALGFSAYADGTRIVSETGLFTYETDHPFYEYFHGTRGHNTVVVDGESQREGTGDAQPLKTGDGYAYVSAMHELYDDVRHERALMLIENGAVLIFDRLRGAEPHTYEQVFHLSEHAELDTAEASGASGVIRHDGNTTPFSITQFIPPDTHETWYGDESKRRGLCARGYETLVPCHELAYAVDGTDAYFATLIRFGKDGLRYDVSYDDSGEITITTPERQYTVEATLTEHVPSDRFIALDVSTKESRTTARDVWDRIRAEFERLF